MSGGLQIAGDEGASGGAARCSVCGAAAVGPCASCRTPVCGDCCVLTEGGVETYAICVRCDRRKGRQLGSGWRVVVGWLVLVLVARALFAGACVVLLR